MRKLIVTCDVCGLEVAPGNALLQRGRGSVTEYLDCCSEKCADDAQAQQREHLELLRLLAEPAEGTET